MKVAQGVGTISQEEFGASAYIAHESAMEELFGSLASLRQPAAFDIAFARTQHDALIDATLGLGRASTVPAIPAFDLAFARSQHDALIDSGLNVGQFTVSQPGAAELAFARSQHDALIDSSLNVGQFSGAVPAPFDLAFARSQHDVLIESLALS